MQCINTTNYYSLLLLSTIANSLLHSLKHKPVVKDRSNQSNHKRYYIIIEINI